MINAPNLWHVIIGLVIGLSFLLGALLYKWTKEEVDKSYKHIIWAQLILFCASYFVFAWLVSFYYLILFAAVAVISYFVVKTINFKETEYWQAFIMGAATVFLFALDFGKLASVVLLVYTILLSSVICKGADSFKKAGRLVLNFLTVFIILILFPFGKIISIHSFFVIYSLLLPLIFYQLAKEKLL